MTITQTLCQEFQTAPWQIDAVIRLLDEGCTLPFIARYRKEQHGSLDDQKLREISERLTALRALEARRQEISESLQKLDVWTEKLQSDLDAAATSGAIGGYLSPVPPEAPHPRVHCQGEGAGAARERADAPAART